MIELLNENHRLLHSGHHRHLHNHTRSDHGHGNYTITASVSIRVTPVHDHFVSWGILWSAFVLVSVFATWQVIKESRILKSRSAQIEGEGDQAGVGAVGDAESVSTADITRSMFRRLILLAMTSRIVLMPVQIWSYHIWWQFVSDSLPEMVFVSAYTLLVTFFVQLVGIATGTGTNTSPGIVITATAYVVYFFLIITQLYNKIASVLLYALLCGIYSTLFGIVVYFCPRLMSILRSSLDDNNGLSSRLNIATVVCLVVFAAHALSYARLVVAPPKYVYWWWQYGVLELIPASAFLILMRPASNKKDRSFTTPDVPSRSLAKTSGMLRRVDSQNSNSGHPAFGPASLAGARRVQETCSLTKGSIATYGSNYGATD